MSREIVIPGEQVGSNAHMMGQNVYALDGQVYSSVMGIKNERENEISVVPLKGKYLPVDNDTVVGIIKSEKFSGYEVDINSFYTSFVNKKELRDPLKVGTIVSCKIIKVNELNEADIGFVRPLGEGELIKVVPARVPRIIGKNNSMLNVVKNGTGSSVFVGKNGLVYLTGGNVELAKEVLLRINDNAHVENLTLDTQKFLAVKTGGGMPSAEGSASDGFESHHESSGGGYSSHRSGGYGGGRGGFGGGRGGGGSFGGGDRGGFRPRNNFRSGGFSGGDRGGERSGGYGGGRSGGGGFGGNRSFGGPRNSFGGGDRGHSSGGFGGGERSGGFAPRRSFNSDSPGGGDFQQRPMRRNFGEQRGFGENRGFGNNYNPDSRPPRSSEQNQEPSNFDRRKRFPRDNRNSGNDDPDFE